MGGGRIDLRLFLAFEARSLIIEVALEHSPSGQGVVGVIFVVVFFFIDIVIVIVVVVDNNAVDTAMQRRQVLVRTARCTARKCTCSTSGICSW